MESTNKPGNNGNILPMGKGRPKGSKNKFTTLKQSFLDAFEAIGGTEELTRWGKKPLNRESFYKMVTKLLPKAIDTKLVDDDGDDILRDILANVQGVTRGLPSRDQDKIEK